MRGTRGKNSQTAGAAGGEKLLCVIKTLQKTKRGGGDSKTITILHEKSETPKATLIIAPLHRASRGKMGKISSF